MADHFDGVQELYISWWLLYYSVVDMTEKPQAVEGAISQGEESTGWKQCMLCQSDADKEQLVQYPRIDSYQRVLDAVEERASVHDGNYVEVQRRLQGCTKNTLCKHQAVYHRSCYASATNRDQIQRARDRHVHALPTGCHTSKKRGQKRGSTEMDESGPSTFGSSTPFTRSRTIPLDKERCFFCQKDEDEQLYQVRTVNAGKNLKEDTLKTRLNTCIAPGDAHSIDARYHKTCWTEHVFHEQRKGIIGSKTENKQPLLQHASLLELINLIDVQTLQNQARLPMEDIETTYVNTLGT